MVAAMTGVTGRGPAGGGGAAGGTVRRVRDLLVLDACCGDEAQLLVLACDSAGGVGPKPLDGVRATGRVVGLFTARVALMEIVAAGATPRAVTLAVSCEPEPTGREVAAGVLEEMALAGLGPESLVVSTEKNLPTRQTGVGVTVLGTVSKAAFIPGRARAGDALALVGQPKVGAEVREDDPEITGLATLQHIMQSGCVTDIVPVGSRGAAVEAAELAAAAGLVPSLCAGAAGVLARSGGPATALVVSVRPERLDQLERITRPRPCRLIGWLHKPPARGAAREA